MTETASEPAPRRPGLLPSDMAATLATPLISSSPDDGWEGVVLQRFKNLPRVIEVPGMQDEVLVCHLAGPFLAETGRGSPHYERRWIDCGCMGVNPSGLPVHRLIKGKPDVVLVHLPPAMMRSVAEEMFDVDPARVELVPTLSEPDHPAHDLARLLLAEAQETSPGTKLMIETVSRALMIHVLRRHSNLAPPPADRLVGMSPGRVRRVIDFMQASMDRPMSLTDLARIGGLSPSRFSRAFRAATGLPPHRYLIGLRIDKARELLEQTELPVIQVGLRCGFDHPSHFASMFRKVVGMSPQAWRAERRM